MDCSPPGFSVHGILQARDGLSSPSLEDLPHRGTKATSPTLQADSLPFEPPETRVQSPGWEDPLEEEMATHSSILPGESHGQRSLAGYSQWGCKELDMIEAT